MRRTFASVGLPETVVSDNAATFTSEEFGEFMRRNGIRHVRSPPYHPASNGLVERAAQTFKEGMKHQKSGTLNTRLSRFLLPGLVVSLQGTAMYEVRLSDNRIVIRHLDQLRPRVSDGEPVTMASGSATEELVMAEDTSAPVQEPESAGDSVAIEVPEPGGAP